MSKIDSFEDMKIWQEARIITKNIYAVTRKDSFSKDYGLRDQIQRASVSIMSNVSEGFERGSNKEFIQFLYIAKGSAGEVRSQLYVALDLGYVNKEAFNQLNSSLISISNQISGFVKYLQTSNMKGQKR